MHILDHITNPTFGIWANLYDDSFAPWLSGLAKDYVCGATADPLAILCWRETRLEREVRDAG
jgi:hypothetical protein